MRYCEVCGKPENDHPFRHPFVSMGQDPGSAVKNEKQGKVAKEGRLMAAVGGDPALRLALMNAGIITYADLARAEEELRNAGASGLPTIATPPRAADPEDRSTQRPGGD